MKSLKIEVLEIFVVLSLCYTCVVPEEETKQAKKTYIVHMDKSNMPESFTDHTLRYASSLKSLSESASMLYTYETVIHGYSTRLTLEEAELLAKQSGVLFVLPEVRYELHTTRTPKFLGLEKSTAYLPTSTSMTQMIVGILDTGVWPELKSFDDSELGSVPSRWKGECEVGKNFNSSTCNRKLIGARFFRNGYEAEFEPIDETTESISPRDDIGHGQDVALSRDGNGSWTRSRSVF